MIIAVDGYEANVSERVGVGRYAYEILRHIHDDIKYPLGPARGGQISKITPPTFRIYLPSRPLPDMPTETSWWQYRVVGPKKFWTFIGLPLSLMMDKPQANVIFSPTHYAPRWVRMPKVISIMDVSYLDYPDMFRLKDLHQLVNWTKCSVENAIKILTISQFSKNAIIKAYDVPRDKVVVTYPGMTKISNSKYPLDPARGGQIANTNIPSKYKIGKNYILSVGTLQPRKNFVRLIGAFSKIQKQHTDFELVIVGKKGWLYEEILGAPKKYGVAESVKFLDFVEDSDLPAFYRQAMCLVLPSLYEGFGLPVLEAMAYGTPVVASNTSSLPEVAGEAGIYVDPLDTESIASGIKAALTEHGTKPGKDRILLGKQLAKQFTWEKAARQTLEVLEEIARGK